MSREYQQTITGWEEQRRIVAKVHVSREDQMGDTIRDLVLAESNKPLNETTLQSAIERVTKNG